MVIFAIVNMLGIRPYATIEIVMTAIMWFTLVIFGLLGTCSSRRPASPVCSESPSSAPISPQS